MGHHYVPARYLAGFTRDDRLWAFHKAAGRPFKTQPDSIANERQLYSEELENQLNNDIEQPANLVLEKIRLRQRLDANDQEALARYMVIMLKRVPTARARVLEMTPGVADEVTDELIRDLHALKGRSAISDAKYTAMLAEAARVREKLKVDQSSATWWGTLAPKESDRVADGMLKMNWAMVIDPSGQVLTCDNPVYFFPWAGISRPESELIFPIDQHTVLLGTHEQFATCSYIEGKAVALREMNRRMIGNADRHIFAADSFGWVPKAIKNGGGPRIRLRVNG